MYGKTLSKPYVNVGEYALLQFGIPQPDIWAFNNFLFFMGIEKLSSLKASDKEMHMNNVFLLFISAVLDQ